MLPASARREHCLCCARRLRWSVARAVVGPKGERGMLGLLGRTVGGLSMRISIWIWGLGFRRNCALAEPDTASAVALEVL